MEIIFRRKKQFYNTILRVLFLVILFAIGHHSAFAYPQLLNQKYIIDTDCATDDFCALTLLLSRPEIEISAIVVSEGTLEPQDGIKKVKSLLDDWGKQTIPVFCNTTRLNIRPAWRNICLEAKWGSKELKSDCEDFSSGLTSVLKNESDESHTLLCLASLSTASDLLMNEPQLISKFKRIVWYTLSYHPLQGFNYECDKVAADNILKSSRIRIDIISNLGMDNLVFNQNMLETAKRNNNQLAQKLTKFYSQPAIEAKLKESHFVLKDELTALYILRPELFGMTLKPPEIRIRYNISVDSTAIKELMEDLIKGVYSTERNIVFSSFPSHHEQFNYDVRQMMDSAIAWYGKEEWKACVMTDEFHGHLGVFSIVGAKMGIMARELFGVGTDQLHVVSFAGTNPPYSCLNDGIQVSTGATLGQGLISVSSDSITCPEAIFSYNGKSLKIKLKDEYLKIINNDIQEGVVKFGLLDDGYWKLIRQSALRYWLQWDRNKIFDITAP
jgi:pyrimidine-specific ribonucleoside hydrolase